MTADIRFARGHYAVERSDNPFETFQRLQTVNLALVGSDFCRGGVDASRRTIVVGLFAFLFLDRESRQRELWRSGLRLAVLARAARRGVVL